MKITKEWLEKKDACSSGIKWFSEQAETDGKKIVLNLIAEKKHNWANWLIARLMGQKQYLSYAVFAAEQVLDNFEKKYPDDKRPRQAIEVAKKCLKKDTKENRSAADSGGPSGGQRGGQRVQRGVQRVQRVQRGVQGGGQRKRNDASQNFGIWIDVVESSRQERGKIR